MVNATDNILASPSKPSPALEARLRELKKYDSLKKVPPQIVREIGRKS